MQALAEFPVSVAARVHTLFSDIDDTLSSDGRLSAAAYGALERLRAAGLRVILVTGRPAGWCDLIARMWPVDGVIGENGAFYCWHDSLVGKLCYRHLLSEAERHANTARLQAVRDQILQQVPDCALASDQFCRLYDLAIDFCEDVAALPSAEVQRIVALMTQAGMTAKVSSIHVNGWFGRYDKLSMAQLMLSERYGLQLAHEREHCVFVGDSPNDAPMFAYLPFSVGVANVARFAGQIDALPRFITPSSSGQGFVELANHLIEARLSAAAPA